MTIYLERIYNEPQHTGYRVLADRIWPRGMTKEKARLDDWCKDIAPSTDLRKWFGHDPEKWTDFKKRYQQELKAPAARDAARDLLKKAGKKSIVLLSGTRDTDHVHTLVLKDYLEHLT